MNPILAAIRAVAILCCLLVAAGSGLARQASGPLDLGTIESGSEISRYLSFLKDSDGTVTIERLLLGQFDDAFRPLRETQQFSRARAAYWFRLDLTNSLDRAVERLLVIGYPNLQKISYYDFDARTGTLRELHRDAAALANQVDVRHRLPIYRLDLDPHEQQSVFLRVQSPTIRTGMQVWDPARFIESGLVSEWWFMVFVGVVLAANVYLLVISIVTRSQLYGALFSVAVMLLLLQFTMHGHAYLLFGGLGGLFNVSWLLVQAWTSAAVVVFAYLYLGGSHLPAASRVGLLGLAGAFLAVGVFSIVDYVAAMRLVQPMIVIGAPFLIGVTIHQLIRGNRDALLFLACWVPMLALAVLVNLNGAGIIGNPQLGTIFAAAWIPTTIVFFVFSVVFRAQVEKRESDEKSSFMAILSHEVRTPLTGILGTVDLLRETPLSARQSRFVDNLSHSGKALLTLLNDVLELSKFEAGKTELHVGPTDPAGLVESMADLMAPRAAAKGVALSSEVQGPVPELVLADEVRLRQVLLNLVSNAVKFTDKGHIHVRLIGRETPGRIARLRFEVEDEGIGFPESLKAELFKPFAQAEDVSSRSHEGTGLGLSICKGLVELMGGKIEARSEPGKGSCFGFEIPAEVLAGAPAARSEAGREDPAVAPSGDGLHILIVDDTAMNRDVIGDLMRSRGFRVSTAGSGPEALAMLEEQSFDALVLDAFMPDMNGLQVAARLRREGNAIPIIGLTAAVDRKLVRECLAKGMNEVLHKPVQVDELATGILRLVAQDTGRAQRPLLNERTLDGYAGSLGAERLRAHLEEFPGGIATLMTELAEAVSAGRRDDQSRICHKLAGSAAMLGFERFGLEAETLAATLRDGAREEILPGEHRDLAQTLESSLEALDAYLGQLPS